MADVWRTGDDVERGGKFVKKQVARGTAILSPPVVDRADLSVGLRCGGDRQAHRRWRNSSRIAEAGRTRPASAEAHDVDSAACSARRSSSVKSSPSSSATRSMTVPSGNVVGSSRMRRPFSTRARSGLMRLLYGDRRRPASAQAGRTQRLDLLEPGGNLFQLAGGRDATSARVFIGKSITPRVCEVQERVVGQSDGCPSFVSGLVAPAFFSTTISTALRRSSFSRS